LTRWTPTNCVNSSPRCRNVTFGVLFRDNGYIRNPHRLVRALAEAFLRDGGEIIQDEAIGFVLEGGRLRDVRTPSAVVPATSAVVAAGAHSLVARFTRIEWVHI
jgi:D-amino-acid dehydrogenase